MSFSKTAGSGCVGGAAPSPAARQRGRLWHAPGRASRHAPAPRGRVATPPGCLWTASALLIIAACVWRRRAQAKARDCYTRMLAAAQACPDDEASRAARAVGHNCLGVCLQALGDHSLARSHHQEQLALADQVCGVGVGLGRCACVRVCVCAWACVYAELALTDHACVCVACGCWSREARATHAIGAKATLAHALSHSRSPTHSHSLARPRALHDAWQPGKFVGHLNLGLVQSSMGEMEEAAISYRHALRCAIRAGSLQGEAVACGNLALVGKESGDLETARACALPHRGYLAHASHHPHTASTPPTLSSSNTIHLFLSPLRGWHVVFFSPLLSSSLPFSPLLSSSLLSVGGMWSLAPLPPPPY